MEVPNELLALTRAELDLALNKNQKLKSLADVDSIIVHRTAYTGDYKIEGFKAGRGFSPIAKFGMMPMPGCRGICVFHHAEVEEKLRGIGVGTILLRIRTEVAKIAGYSLLLCTVQEINSVERHLLESTMWQRLPSFINKTTGHTIALYNKRP